MQTSGTAPSIESLLRSVLSDHPDGVMAFDLAVHELVMSEAASGVTSAMKAEAAAAILELVASGHLQVDDLAQHAVRRVHATGFRLPRTAYAD
jgi:hypothetical protein